MSQHIGSSGPLDYEVPRPPVRRTCRRCGVTAAQVDAGYVLVSPVGTAHNGSSRVIENTLCGIDATGVGWWWPL